MKKYLIMAVAVLASLTACQQNEPEATFNDGVIRFKNAPATRATETTTIGDNFKVLGYVGSTELFNATASKNGTVWETQGVTKYWADATAYTFFAVYPEYTIAKTDKDNSTVEYTNVSGEEDVVMAGLSMTSGVAKNQNPAALTFKHALSRVKFAFVNGFNANTGVIVEVENVKLLGRAGEKATATINSANTISWGAVTDGTSNIEYAFETGDGMMMTEGAAAEVTEYNYIIPAKNVAYKLGCTVSVYAKLSDGEKGNLIHTYDFTEGTPITDAPTTFGQGMSYVYTMTVSDALKPITFSVSVEKWADDTAGDINFDTTK